MPFLPAAYLLMRAKVHSGAEFCTLLGHLTVPVHLDQRYTTYVIANAHLSKITCSYLPNSNTARIGSEMGRIKRAIDLIKRLDRVSNIVKFSE